MAETQNHRDLKRLALVWAQAHGYACCGYEVALPRSNFRADLAAYRPRSQPLAPGAVPVLGATAIFECKQSRADLLNDCSLTVALSATLSKLHERRTALERLLRVHHPSLANSDSLFAEWTTFNLEALDHRGYQTVLRRIAVTQRKVLLNNKFEKIMRYRCSNVCYLVVEDGIIGCHELPVGWGLLVRRKSARSSGNGRCDDTGAGTGGNNLVDRLELVCKPAWQETSDTTRLALLQRIATAGTRLVNARESVTCDERWAARRKAVEDL